MRVRLSVFAALLTVAPLDENQTLQLVDYFAPPNANWMRARDLDMNVTPVVFDHAGRKFLVGSSKECRMWLLDRDALGGEDRRTSLHTTPHLCNDDQAYDAKGVWGAMASWEDPQGARWILVPFWGPVSRTFRAPIEHSRPTMGGVAAYKVQRNGAGWQLAPAWLSRDMDVAEEVIVANGIVFAFASGEDVTQSLPDLAWDEPWGPWVGGGLNPYSERRVPNSRHATIYALDGQTGKELWSSGKEITSFNHFSGFALANGRVYLGTYDGMLYSFGVALIAAIGPGPAGPDGFANAVVALDPKTLTVKDWFTRPGVAFAAAPLLFREGGKDIVVITTKDGRILLLDAASLGGSDHATPLHTSAVLTSGAATFASHAPALWQERIPAQAVPGTGAPATPNVSGTRWLLLPVSGRLGPQGGGSSNGPVTGGAIVAVKVVAQAGGLSIEPGWTSENVSAPLTPIVVNGVAFALASAQGSRAPGGRERCHWQDVVAQWAGHEGARLRPKLLGRIRSCVCRHAGRNGVCVWLRYGAGRSQPTPLGAH